MSKRLRFILLLVSIASASVSAETTLSAGGGARVDPMTANPLSPFVDTTLLGDMSWIPGDRIGFFMDWSAGGGYEPLLNAVNGLAAATVDGSYMAGTFLARLSLSSVASYSTEDAFYGAGSSELLLSYGGPEFSVFAAPRYSIVETTYLSMQAGGRLGTSFLVADSFLIKLAVEGGVAIPGGTASGWSLMPSLALDWYSGGQLTMGMKGGYRKSYSTVLSTLVTGGPLLPLDTYDRLFLEANASWLTKKGVTIAARLPADYTLKAYNAFSGSVDLGTPAWLAELTPELSYSVPLGEHTDLVTYLNGDFGFSNNLVEQASAVSAAVRFELHF